MIAEKLFLNTCLCTLFASHLSIIKQPFLSGKIETRSQERQSMDIDNMAEIYVNILINKCYSTKQFHDNSPS